MSLIDDYPSSSPENTYYLPLDRRREYLSIFDNMCNHNLKSAFNAKERYKKSDFFEKNIAIDIINSGINPLKENLKAHLTKDEQKRVFTLLDKHRENIITSLTANPLSRDVYEKIKNILLNTLQEIHLENPLVSKKSPFSFSEDDLQTGGYDYK